MKPFLSLLELASPGPSVDEVTERTIAAEMGDQTWGRGGRWGREP